MTIGKALRVWRTKRHLSQEKAAKLLGVHWMTILRWENGSQKPTGLYLRMIETLTEKIRRQATNSA